MSDLIDTFSNELPLIAVPIRNNLANRFYVPMPNSDAMFVIRWDRDLEEHLLDDRYVLLGNPRSELAAIVMVTAYTRDKKDNFQFVTQIMGRVRLTSVSHARGSLRFAEFEHVDDAPPSIETFEGNEFREKLDRLRVNMTIVANGGGISPRDISLNPIGTSGINRDTVGHVIDNAMQYAMPLAAKSQRLEEHLAKVLDAVDVVERLDIALRASEICLEIVSGDSGGPPGGGRRIPISERKSDGDSDPEYGLDNRTRLARKFFTESKESEEELEDESDEVTEEDDENRSGTDENSDKNDDGSGDDCDDEESTSSEEIDEKEDDSESEEVDEDE